MLLLLIYLTFVCLGVPDAFLGAAWPALSADLETSLSAMGIVTVIFAAGKVAASALSHRLQRRLGAGRLIALSVGITAVSLYGFAASHAFWAVCLWAVPYGLASGSASTAVNKYVALHYENRHMNWLHCMWGVGSALGPYVIALALRFGSWNSGYLWGGILLTALLAVLLLSLPKWRSSDPDGQEIAGRPLSLGQVLRLSGAKPMMLTFFAYCALEQATALWASTYLVMERGVDAASAAGCASLFFIGMTAGRAVSGFLSARLSDDNMVLLGQGFTLAGVLLLLQPFFPQGALPALVVIGLGCAPMMPSLLHATPAHFGAERAQSVMGILMACSNAGTLIMPPLFGWIAGFTGAAIYPWFLGIILAAMFLAHRRAIRSCAAGK